MKEFRIRLERDDQCAALASFLRACDADPRVVAERSLVLDLDAACCPGLATLVAAAEEWRGSAHAREVWLEVAGEVRVLRTEA